MANLPPVKLETHTTWFNLLLTLLREHAQNNPYEEYRQMAQRLRWGTAADPRRTLHIHL